MRIIFICLHLTLPASASSSHTPNNSMSLGLPVWHQPQHPSTTVLLSLLCTCPGILYFIVVIPKHHVLGTLLLICIKWFSVVTNENFSLNSIVDSNLTTVMTWEQMAMSAGAVTLNGLTEERKEKKKNNPKSKNIALVSCAAPSALSCVKQTCECTQLCGWLESDTQWHSTFPLGLIHFEIGRPHLLSWPSVKVCAPHPQTQEVVHDAIPFT